MVISPSTILSPITIACVSFGMFASPGEACQPWELVGNVKSIVVSEVLIDSDTGKPVGENDVLQIVVAQDGSSAETTLALSGKAAGPPAKSITYFKDGRPIRAVEIVKGKTVPSMACAYDSQGRLIEATTGSENTEFLITETYEYGPGFIRRRTKATPGGSSITTQTLDKDNRVIKETVIDEATSTAQRTREFAYDGNRKQACETSSGDSHRQCTTSVQDSHGNEIESVAEGRIRRTSFEYDSVGNWISRTTSVSGPRGMTIVTIERRAIEYW